MRRNIRTKNRVSTQSEQGYVLLTLLLFMALLIIAAGTIASSLAFTIRRDREEELIHRGVQYTRAIREFTRKTGRFPMRLEELDNTDGRRFLRKRYKDPITGQDFKLVHMADVQIGGTVQIPGAQPIADPATAESTDGTTPQPDDSTNARLTDPNQNPPQAPRPNQAFNTGPSQQPISGGLIVGVVSASKDKTIREFNRKNHYNQWRFYYDTAFDRNYLVNAPTEKSLFQSNSGIPNLNGNPQSPTAQAPPSSGADSSLPH